MLNQDIHDGKTLSKNFVNDFKADNSYETAECTVTKANWFGEVDAKKRVGSKTPWLENTVDAEFMLRLVRLSYV